MPQAFCSHAHFRSQINNYTSQIYLPANIFLYRSVAKKKLKGNYTLVLLKIPRDNGAKQQGKKVNSSREWCY